MPRLLAPSEPEGLSSSPKNTDSTVTPFGSMEYICLSVPEHANTHIFSADQGKNDTSFYPCGLLGLVVGIVKFDEERTLIFLVATVTSVTLQWRRLVKEDWLLLDKFDLRVTLVTCDPCMAALKSKLRPFVVIES